MLLSIRRRTCRSQL